MYSINYIVLKSAASVLEANGAMSEAVSLYDLSANYTSSYEPYLNAGVAYYKLSKKYAHKATYYLAKAKKMLEKALMISDGDPKIHYYLGMVYSEMDNAKQAFEQFSALENYPEFMSDTVIVSTIDAYITAAMISVREDEKAYDIIEDPFLISLYDFIKPRLIDSGKADALAKKYKTTPHIAIAKEIVDTMNFIIKEIGDLPIASRFEALIYFLIRGRSDEEKSFVLNHLKSYGFDLDELPPYTRGVIKEFRSKFGIGGDVKIPYFISEDIQLIAKVNRILVELMNDRLLPDKALKEVMKLVPRSVKESLVISDDVVDKMYAVEFIKKVIKRLLERMRDRALAFFDISRVKSIVKATISTLSLSDYDKLNIVSSLF